MTDELAWCSHCSASPKDNELPGVRRRIKSHGPPDLPTKACVSLSLYICLLFVMSSACCSLTSILPRGRSNVHTHFLRPANLSTPTQDSINSEPNVSTSVKFSEFCILAVSSQRRIEVRQRGMALIEGLNACTC